MNIQQFEEKPIEMVSFAASTFSKILCLKIDESRMIRSLKLKKAYFSVKQIIFMAFSIETSLLLTRETI